MGGERLRNTLRNMHIYRCSKCKDGLWIHDLEAGKKYIEGLVHCPYCGGECEYIGTVIE